MQDIVNFTKARQRRHLLADSIPVACIRVDTACRYLGNKGPEVCGIVEAQLLDCSVRRNLGIAMLHEHCPGPLRGGVTRE